MTWPVDKLAAINDALGQTGDYLVNVADDGSDEWNTASLGYEAAIEYMTESHNWGFATQIAVLNRVGASPDPLFADAYAKPDNLLHLVWVRANNLPLVYQVISNQICLNARGAVITGKWVQKTGLEQGTPTFIMALRAFILSAIYRGLHQDTGEADRMWAAGERFVQQARTRADQETPKRAPFNSRMAMARRVRRPWPPVPGGWGGAGGPG